MNAAAMDQERASKNVSDSSRIESRAARRAFDRAAKRFGEPALISEDIATRMASRMDLMRIAPDIVLDAGCGISSAKRWIGDRYPAAAFIHLDWSREMLLRTERKSGIWSRLTSTWRRGSEYRICADLRAIPLANESVDLIWSNLALPWAFPADRAFHEFARVLRSGGLLMFSSYGPDTLAELREAFGMTDLVARVHEFSDMHDLGDALVAAGMSAPVMDMEKLTVSHANAQALMDDLRRAGEVNVLERRLRGLTPRRRFLDALGKLPTVAADGRVKSTFEIIYGHAWKSGPRIASGASRGNIAKIKWSPRA
jgi:malonyl-CoA O-methyltransferase